MTPSNQHPIARDTLSYNSTRSMQAYYNDLLTDQAEQQAWEAYHKAEVKRIERQTFYKFIWGGIAIALGSLAAFLIAGEAGMWLRKFVEWTVGY